MPNGCVSEVDMFMAFRHESDAAAAEAVLRHVVGCPLCHEHWRRFGMDERVADGIRCALQGNVTGADAAPGAGLAQELPEQLDIPGFDIEPGYIEGGQARVYRATYVASQELVAIKVFHDVPLDGATNVRFSREMKSLARLRHPHVVPIRSDGEVLGHAYFVMPWIEGQPLNDFVHTHDLNERLRVELLCKVADAVHHAHRRGVMHLDLKPSNVRVDAAGEPVVLDFGLALLIDLEHGDSAAAFRGGGTPHYMAPEQVEGLDDLDMRADVFGLGMLAYEVLTGTRARDVPSADGWRSARTIATHQPEAPRQRCPAVGRELDAIISKAITPQRERRYQSAGELLDDLRRYLDREVVAAMADNPVYRIRKALQRHHLVVLALALASVMLAMGMVIKMGLDRSEREMLARNAEIMSQLDKRLEQWRVDMIAASEEGMEVNEIDGDTVPEDERTTDAADGDEGDDQPHPKGRADGPTTVGPSGP